MISAYWISMLACLAAAGFVWYAFKSMAAIYETPIDDARVRAVKAGNARVAGYAVVLCAIVSVACFTWAGYADGPAPGPAPWPVDPVIPPGPGPGPTPTPTPAGFAGRVQAAFKTDGGTRGLAVVLGAMAQHLGQEITSASVPFKNAEDIGAHWEKKRGRIFQPLILWAPKTQTAIAAEAVSRGLDKAGPLNGNRQQFAQFYTEIGKALLAYE